MPTFFAKKVGLVYNHVMINHSLIENAVYNLCIQANTILPDNVFSKLLAACSKEENKDAKEALELILMNAKSAYISKKPLCQDTGQVLVFVKIGGKCGFDFTLAPSTVSVGNKCYMETMNDAINRGVQRAYKDNFYRQSVVKNALFERINTQTNTPCIIHTEIVDGTNLEIEILIKGAGSENVSQIKMMSPTSTEEEIIDYIVSCVKSAGSKGCPPYFLGIGIGGTIEHAGLLSKKALLLEKNIDDKHQILAQKIKHAVNDLKIGVAGLGGASTALDVKILTDFTHIASMPVAVTINCHSSRHAKCIIQDGKINYFEPKIIKSYTPESENFFEYVKVNANEIDRIKSLKKGQKVLLSGEIYTARDAAHKRLVEMIEKGEKLPFDLKNKIIFYAGPCPCPNNCVVGSIGPTTASRMDKFAPILYKEGILATIGKGERSEEVRKAVNQLGGVYFTAIGGIASYLSERFIKKDLVAFEDLGTEAIFRFEVKDLPLRVDLV